MNGPGHFARAAELMTQADQAILEADPPRGAVLAAIAQTHATLALAAATALGTSPAEARAWAEVAGTRLASGGT